MSFTGEFSTKLHEFMEAAVSSPEKRLRLGSEEVLQKVHEKWEQVTEGIRGLFGTAYDVDEMALYFPDRDLLFVFMAEAIKRGWQAFNCAEDNVTTAPIPGAYEVEYWFLQSPSVPYRLELMVINDGFSPYHASVHEALRIASAPGSLVHASFKVANETEYASVGVALRNGGFELAQHCESSYGRFSYFVVHPQDDRYLPTVKPRINLRDATTAESGAAHWSATSGNWVTGGGDSGN